MTCIDKCSQIASYPKAFLANVHVNISRLQILLTRCASGRLRQAGCLEDYPATAASSAVEKRDEKRLHGHQLYRAQGQRRTKKLRAHIWSQELAAKQTIAVSSAGLYWP